MTVERRQTIPNDNRGIRTTVERMAHYIRRGIPVSHSRITALASAPYFPALSGILLGELTDESIEAAMYWVRGRMHYTPHPPDEQLLHDPVVLLNRMMQSPDGRATGDCVDYTILLGAIYVTMGLPTRIVVQSKRADGIHEHVYLRVLTRGQGWMAADPSGESAFGYEDPDVTLREDLVL